MAANEESEVLDTDALRAYLESEFHRGESIEHEQLEGGNANETFLIRWGGDEYVLRMPPRDESMQSQLHNILQEYTLFQSLRKTSVPVPEPVLCCTDETVIGSEFYLMEYLQGDFLPDGIPPRFQSETYKQQLGEIIIDSLVAIHELDSNDVPLDPSTSPDEILRNEVTRWIDQLDKVASLTESERSLPDYNGISEWLEESVPDPSDPALVHGDYKPDNLMFAKDTPPEIIGILDWEMSEIGDPLTDLGWLLSYWADPDDERTTARTYMQDDLFYDRNDLVERYESKSGREFSNHRFYRALAVFKLAAICEGFFATYVTDPESAKKSYPFMETLVPELLKRTERIIDGQEPI